MKYLLTIGIPALCLVMFLRELIVSYFIRPKIEMYLSSGILQMKEAIVKINERLTSMEYNLSHNVSRMSADMTNTSKISDIIAAARAKLLASRAYILRFHNGSTFSTNTPVWKFSITNESTDSAISSIADCTRDILVSNNIQLLSPLFDTTTLDDGMRILSKDEFGKLDTLRIDMTEVQSNTLKGFLVLRGIKHLFYSPILDTNGNAVGVFCLDYISDVPEFMTDDYAAKEMDEFSSMISTIFC